MPERLVKQPVNVVRDGKLTEPTIGKPFDFTDAELKDIEKLNPTAIAKIVVEDAEVAVPSAKK
jgi:hypothetical protein